MASPLTGRIIRPMHKSERILQTLTHMYLRGGVVMGKGVRRRPLVCLRGIQCCFTPCFCGPSNVALWEALNSCSSASPARSPPPPGSGRGLGPLTFLGANLLL